MGGARSKSAACGEARLPERGRLRRSQLLQLPARRLRHRFRAAVSILSGGPLQREFTFTPRVGPRGREYTLQNVFGGDHDYFRAQIPWVLAERNAAALSEKSRIRMVIGGADEMLSVAREFQAHLTRLGIPHACTEVPGVGHQPLAILNGLGGKNEEFYRAVFEKAASR